MEIQLLHNITAAEIPDLDFATLYEKRRRIADFAAVVSSEERGSTYALRDHLGVAPLFYRRTESGWRFAIGWNELVRPGDTVNERGLRLYLGLGSDSVVPLVNEIGVVPPGHVLEFRADAAQPRTSYRYQLQPRAIPWQTSQRELVQELHALLRRAMERTLVKDEVGLLLSGGVDSFLMGALLKELGVHVRAYTSARWGKISSEYTSAQACADVLGIPIQFDELKTAEYATLFTQLAEHYPRPPSMPVAIGIVSLLENTDASSETQVFYDMYVDLTCCSSNAQYRSIFASFLPNWLTARKLNPKELSVKERYSGHDATEIMLHFLSKGIVQEYELLHEWVGRGNLLQRLCKTSIYFWSDDEETVTLPFINAGIRVSDFLYDVDAVEFNMGVPLRHRLAMNLRSTYILTLEKHLYLKLAYQLGYPLPVRSKGFIVPFHHDQHARDFASRLPKSWGDIRLLNDEHRFAAASLDDWARRHDIAALRLPATKTTHP